MERPRPAARLTEFASRHRSELRQATRAAAAAALALVIGEALALPQSYWAVMTALIIVQSSLGGTLAAGIDRLAGTLAGAAAGALAAVAGASVAGDAEAADRVLLLALTVAPLALLAAKRPSFRVAPVTAAIVILGNAGGASPPVAALERVIEIALGTVIGLGVSLVLFPSRAREICFARSADALAAMGEGLRRHLEPPSAEQAASVEAINARIRAALGKVAAAAEEARREHQSRMTGEPIPPRLVRTLRRLRSDVAFVGRATAGRDLDWQRVGPALAELAATFAAAFAGLAQSLRGEGPAPALAPLDDAIARLQSALADPAGPAPSEGAGALPFVMETLRRDLADLADALSPGPGGRLWSRPGSREHKD